MRYASYMCALPNLTTGYVITKAKMLCSVTSVTDFQQIFPMSFSVLAVSCLEFFHTVDLPESFVVAESPYACTRKRNAPSVGVMSIKIRPPSKCVHHLCDTTYS